MTAPAGVGEGSEAEIAQVEVEEPESAAAGGPVAEDSREQSPEAAAEPDAAETGVAEPEATQPGMAGTEMAETPAQRDMSPLAVVGVIVCVIALVGVAAGALFLLTHGFHKKTVVTVKHKAAAVFSLRPGDCIDTGAGVAFTRVACSTPHDAEVFATFSLTGSSWPGTKAVQADAGNGCAARLSGYLNPALATAALAQAYVYPDQSAWQASERTVICEVSSSTGQLTGSVRNPA